jgi:hypothetical protein
MRNHPGICSGGLKGVVEIPLRTSAYSYGQKSLKSPRLAVFAGRSHAGISCEH